MLLELGLAKAFGSLSLDTLDFTEALLMSGLAVGEDLCMVEGGSFCVDLVELGVRESCQGELKGRSWKVERGRGKLGRVDALHV